MTTVVNDVEQWYELNGAGLLKCFLSVNRPKEALFQSTLLRKVL